MVVTTLVIFLGAVLIGAIVRAIWRRGRRHRVEPLLNVDFSMADLQKLRDSGKLTPEEFERARTIVLRRAQERDAEADSTRGHAFAVIQKVIPVDPVPPPPPAEDDQSRDAR
jgi:hypothetical protein